MVVGAAMPGWFRFKMKLDPKANDRVRTSWRLRKSIPSSFREERESVYDTCANGFLGSVKRGPGRVVGNMKLSLTPLAVEREKQLTCVERFIDFIAIGKKSTQKGKKTQPLCALAGFVEISTTLLERNGGDDETRTRDLCRDSPALSGN